MNEKLKKVWENHREYVELLSKVNNSCVFVAEYQAGYIFLSDNFSIFGYDPKAIYAIESDPEYLENRIHPADLEVLRVTQAKLLEFIQDYPVNQRKDYKHIYELRARNAEGKYINFILQQQILELDEEGNAWLLLGIVDISPDISPLEQIKLRVINYKTGEVIPYTFVETGNNVKLSDREKEILGLARKGMLTKEISDKLSLSIHTVNKHRQNIMQKMNADNILEAIDYARKLGLLE